MHFYNSSICPHRVGGLSSSTYLRVPRNMFVFHIFGAVALRTHHNVTNSITLAKNNHSKTQRERYFREEEGDRGTHTNSPHRVGRRLPIVRLDRTPNNGFTFSAQIQRPHHRTVRCGAMNRLFKAEWTCTVQYTGDSMRMKQF